MLSQGAEDHIRFYVTMIVGEELAARFLDLRRSVEAVKRESPPWQAASAIGVYAALWPMLKDGEPLRNLVANAMEPIEALCGTLIKESNEKPLEQEQARLLFHARFALGFLALANGETERAWTIFHEVAATRLSRRGIAVTWGEGILESTPDVVGAKLIMAMWLDVVSTSASDCVEMLFVLVEALACNPLPDILVKRAVPSLDLLASACEAYVTDPGDDLPDSTWLDAFAACDDLLSLCDETDASPDSPERCEIGSAQFLAWKFGQLVARFTSDCLHRSREGAWRVIDFLRCTTENHDLYTPDRGHTVYRTLLAALALVAEYEPGRDWKKARDGYLQMWAMSYATPGARLSEAGPETDLYWAARLGFADSLLARSDLAVASSQQEVRGLLVDIASEVSTTREMLSALSLRELKAHHEIIDRLPPSKSELHSFVRSRFGALRCGLPETVENILAKAERLFRSQENDDEAIVCFAKATEAAIDICFVRPLTEYMHKRRLPTMAIPLSDQKVVAPRTASGIGKMGLRDWADVLDRLEIRADKDLASLGTKDFRGFLTKHLGGPRWPDFRQLAQSLHTVQDHRGASAHWQAERSRGYNRLALEEMRQLVLGKGGTSVIAQIFQLLGQKGAAGDD